MGKKIPPIYFWIIFKRRRFDFRKEEEVGNILHHVENRIIAFMKQGLLHLFFKNYLPVQFLSSPPVVFAVGLISYDSRSTLIRLEGWKQSGRLLFKIQENRFIYPFHFFCHPVVLVSICHQTKLNWLLYESITTEWLKHWSGWRAETSVRLFKVIKKLEAVNIVRQWRTHPDFFSHSVVLLSYRSWFGVVW